ncbi:MAG: PAAR domain-containing protein [Polyangiaceae bacterium]
MPPAARVTDLHTCTRLPDEGAHPETPDHVVEGASNVLVEGRPAARMGDGLAHGGHILTGFASVLVGDTRQTAILREAAVSGVPFCEECERMRGARAVVAGEIVTGADTVWIGRQRAARLRDEARCSAHAEPEGARA